MYKMGIYVLSLFRTELRYRNEILEQIFEYVKNFKK